MGVDDRAADRQPHSHAVRLRRVERLENALQLLRVDAWPSIAYCYENTSVVVFRADQQLSCRQLSEPHCFDGIEDKVEDDLLQLNAISVNGRQSVCKPGLDRDTIPDDRASHHDNHLIDRPIEVKRILSWGRFLDMLAHTADDILSSVGISDDTAKRLPGFIQIRRIHFQETNSHAGIVARSSNGVHYLVGERDSE